MYSASAEVLMLRSLGIPARIAAGFAQGEFETQKNRYTVTQLNSHAWPEVYFPDFGWVEFEPTGNQDPLDRPRETTPKSLTGADQDGQESNDTGLFPDEELLKPRGINPNIPEDENIAVQTQIDPATLSIYLILVLGFLALGIFLIRRYSLADRLPVYLESRYIKNGQQPPAWIGRWKKWAMLTSIERSFHTIDLSLRLLHHQQPAYTTPEERANTLVSLLPSAREAITTMKQEHEAFLFTNHPGSTSAARRAAFIILIKTMHLRVKDAYQFINTRYNRLK